MDISPRAHARISCDRPVDLFATPSGTRLGDGRLLNISVTGALLACDYELKSRATYRLDLTGAAVPIQFQFHIVRIAPRGQKYRQLPHYGIVFELSPEQTKKLGEVVDSIRSQPSPDDDTLLDRLIRGYWSG